MPLLLIQKQFNNPKKFKVVLQKLCEKSFYSVDEYFGSTLLNPWLNISILRNVKFTFEYTSTNLYYNLFVYYLKKVLIVICNALNLCSVTITFIIFDHNN